MAPPGGRVTLSVISPLVTSVLTVFDGSSRLQPVLADSRLTNLSTASLSSSGRYLWLRFLSNQEALRFVFNVSAPQGASSTIAVASGILNISNAVLSSSSITARNTTLAFGALTARAGYSQIYLDGDAQLSVAAGVFVNASSTLLIARSEPVRATLAVLAGESRISAGATLSVTVPLIVGSGARVVMDARSTLSSEFLIAHDAEFALAPDASISASSGLSMFTGTTTVRGGRVRTSSATLVIDESASMDNTTAFESTYSFVVAVGASIRLGTAPRLASGTALSSSQASLEIRSDLTLTDATIGRECERAPERSLSDEALCAQVRRHSFSWIPRAPWCSTTRTFAASVPTSSPWPLAS